ncbi:hypothetical protein B0H14DRAFT_3134743 [Mycena olivaceomarginata]|nr:hypothetical protein B0H14DRAFT_3134743 [Mycena olivaceomarginata]
MSPSSPTSVWPTLSIHPSLAPSSLPPSSVRHLLPLHETEHDAVVNESEREAGSGRACTRSRRKKKKTERRRGSGATREGQWGGPPLINPLINPGLRKRGKEIRAKHAPPLKSAPARLLYEIFPPPTFCSGRDACPTSTPARAGGWRLHLRSLLLLLQPVTQPSSAPPEEQASDALELRRGLSKEEERESERTALRHTKPLAVIDPASFSGSHADLPFRFPGDSQVVYEAKKISAGGYMILGIEQFHEINVFSGRFSANKWCINGAIGVKTVKQMYFPEYSPDGKSSNESRAVEDKLVRKYFFASRNDGGNSGRK